MASAGRRAQVQAAVFGAELARRAAKGQIALSPGTVLRSLQPPSIDQLRRLIDPDGPDRSDPEIRMARATVAALLSTQPALRRHVDRVLNADERQLYREHCKTIVAQQQTVKASLEAVRAKTLSAKALNDQLTNLGSVCGYCDLSSKLANGTNPANWQAVTINHDAEIKAGFDPDSLISRGELSDFLVVTKDLDIARAMVSRAHPLRWAESAPELFKWSEAAVKENGSWFTVADDRETTMKVWGHLPGPHFLYEFVESPWSEYLTYRTENIIRIENLRESDPDPKKPLAEFVALEYKYFLEYPIRSNFGVAEEDGGLDIDRGSYQAVIQKFDSRSDEHSDRLVSLGEPGRLPLKDAILKLGWQDQAHKVTITASKSLRYTTPRQGPPELRSFLNLTSPALLCTFLNRGFCKPIHDSV